jgi:hypothetical protein
MTITVHNNNQSLTWDAEKLVSDLFHNFQSEYYDLMHPELDNYSKNVRARLFGDRARKINQDAERYATYLQFCIDNGAYLPGQNQPGSVWGIINSLSDMLQAELKGNMEAVERITVRVNKYLIEYENEPIKP